MTVATIPEVADALVATIASGTLNGAPIPVMQLSGAMSFTPNSVLVLPPSVGFDELGESFVMQATDWRLRLYSADGRDVTLAADYALLEAVVVALANDSTLGGVIGGGVVVVDSPEPEPVLDADDAPRLLQRDVRVRVFH